MEGSEVTGKRSRVEVGTRNQSDLSTTLASERIFSKSLVPQISHPKSASQPSTSDSSVNVILPSPTTVWFRRTEEQRLCPSLATRFARTALLDRRDDLASSGHLPSSAPPVAGIFEIDTDFSSSDTSLASSSSDEEKKMNKKAAKGKTKKYQAEAVPAYEAVCGLPKFKKKGSSKDKVKCQPPPSLPPDVGQAQTPTNIPEGIGKIDEEKAREALLQFVSENCCYGKGPAQEMQLSNIKLNSAYHYRLETFTEVRKAKWKSDGYQKGHPVDPPEAGEAPLPWEVDVGAIHNFKDEKRKHEVPHTSSVKKCWYCKGKGRVRCLRCKGAGGGPCEACGGSGGGEAGCGSCGGSGHCACSRCHGMGTYSCKVCKGHKKLKWFIQLSTKLDTEKKDFVEEQTDLPDELIKEVKGEKIYEDVQVLVKPLTDFPVEVINGKSQEIVDAESKAYPDRRIVMQRQTVTVVPVSEVDWSWDDMKGTFIIYGLNNKVWFPEYPKKCCCSLL